MKTKKHVLWFVCMAAGVTLAACDGGTTAATGEDAAGGGTSDTGGTVGDAADASGGQTDAVSDTPDVAIEDVQTGTDAQTTDVQTVDTQTTDTAAPKCTAEQKAACDDKLACTVDKCAAPGGECSWALSDGWCFINGQCIAAGEQKPDNACFSCDPTKSTKVWSAKDEGGTCDDGDLCTYDGKCTAGKCVSKVTPCGDDNPCTTDSCDPLQGCLYPNVAAGTGCDDGNACTAGDTCADGKCAGATKKCDDSNPCTDDACDIATGCTHTDNSNACSDGNECTGGDVCAGGQCVAGAVKNCDDGNTCTFDVCNPKTAGGCYHLAKQSACCTGETSICDDGNPCTSDDCDPETSACNHSNNTAVCEDNNACTKSDTCADGGCAGVAIVCDDSNPCTSDACDSAKGCVYTLLPAKACDDGIACTDDACDPANGGCKHTNNTAACEDGDNCTVGDACKDGACLAGSARNCDDGNVCTFDQCYPNVAGGCYHLDQKSPCCIGQTSICDDGIQCTNDDCDPATSACNHTFNTAPCSDGSSCTQNDVCASGVCGGAVLSCDDSNPCTTDACDPAAGCAHGPIDSGTCDDGNPCTTADTCSAGKCVGSGECTCTMTFAPNATKFTYLQIGDGGKLGEGLDIDANPATCAPSGSCSGGINNALGALASFANKPLADAVTKGSVDFVLEYRDLKQGAINLGLYTGKPIEKVPPCDIQTQTCEYNVAASMVNYQKCLPLVLMPGKLAGNVVQAGGKGTNFPFSLPIQAGVTLDIVIYGAQLSGTVTFDANNKIATFDGVLGGAVPKATLAAAIDALPDGSLPLPKDSLKSILDTAVDTDIDSNGDGTLDAASIGLKLHAIQAVIVGTY